MRQLVARLALALFLLAVWEVPGWSAPEAQLKTQLAEQRKLLDDAERVLKGKVPSIPPATENPAQGKQGCVEVNMKVIDQDRNGCVDAREANQWDLIGGCKYKGPNWCPGEGPDVPAW